MSDQTPVEPVQLQPPVLVPREMLSADALQGVVEEFIMREGTDYGFNELSHESKVERIIKQLDKGLVKIVFDPNTETVTMMTEKDWNKIKA